jgi:hypothetical protein
MLSHNRDLHIDEERTPAGTINYLKNKKIVNFDNLEPRLSIAYSLNNNQSVKGSYNRMSQYVHLVYNTASASPFRRCIGIFHWEMLLLFRAIPGWQKWIQKVTGLSNQALCL